MIAATESTCQVGPTSSNGYNQGSYLCMSGDELDIGIEVLLGAPRSRDFLSDEDIFLLAQWESMRFSRKAASILGLTGSVVVLSTVGACELRSRPLTEVSPARARLVAITRGDRLFEPRFTGGFFYAPLAPRRRSMIPRTGLGEVKRLAERSAWPSARARADRGLLKALDGKLDEAIDLFEAASRRSPKDPHILTDLSAAYLLRGEATARPCDFFRSLAAANEALRILPELQEAMFNRSLAMERLHLPEQATRSWGDFLRGLREFGWTREAQLRRERIRSSASPFNRRRWRRQLEAAALSGDQRTVRELVAQQTRSARKLLEEEYLSLWANAHLRASNGVAAGALRIARHIGLALTATVGDTLSRRTVNAIDAAMAKPRYDHRLTLLAEGHIHHARGRGFFGRGAYEDAANELLLAERSFLASASPAGFSSAMYRAYCEKYLSGNEQAIEILHDVVERASARGYRTLVGEGLRMEGLILLHDDEPALGLAAYRRSLAIFEELGDNENAAKTANLLAELFDLQGDEEEAWKHRYMSLDTLWQIGDPDTLYQVYALAAIAALRQGQPTIALSFQEEAVRSAYFTANPVAIAAALFWRGRYYQRLGQEKEAVRDLRAARAEAEKITARSARQQVLIGIDAAEAELESTRSPMRALSLLTEAIALSQETGYPYHQVDLHRERARIYRSLGRTGPAEDDLEKGIRLVEDWRKRTLEEAQKISFSEQTRALFEEMISLQIEVRNDAERALEYLERQRAQALLDLLLASPIRFSEVPVQELVEFTPQPLTGTRISARLPKNTVLISYAVLGERLALWVVGSSGLQFQSTPFDTSRVHKAVRVLRRPNASLQDHNRATVSLYATLIEPVRQHLPVGVDLVLSPDGPLQGIPFAALKDPRTGRYLIEDHALVIAPSASVYLHSVEVDRELSRRPVRRVLSVGNPAFAASEFPNFVALPGAEKEAVGVASVYPESCLLLREEATRTRFLHEIEDSDLVHFSGHSEVNRQNPVRSVLALAPDPASPGSGGIHAHEILNLRLRRPRLVILSACRTAGGRTSQSEGVESLVRAFLAAGVPSVIGTLWAGDDAASIEVLLEFHRRLRANESAASSLRNAQLSALRKEDPSQGPNLAWAAFQLVGGVDSNRP